MNPTAILGALVCAIAIACGGYYEGWEKRGDHEATVALKAARDAAADLAKETARADGLDGQLAKEKGIIHTVTVTVIKQVPKVTTIYKETPNAPAQPIPAAVYTRGFVRLWNAAYGPIGVRAGAVTAADTSAETDILRADIGTDEILGNHIENAGAHADCYVQLNKLIDLELGRPKAAQ